MPLAQFADPWQKLHVAADAEVGWLLQQVFCIIFESTITSLLKMLITVNKSVLCLVLYLSFTIYLVLECSNLASQLASQLRVRIITFQSCIVKNYYMVKIYKFQCHHLKDHYVIIEPELRGRKFCNFARAGKCNFQ